MKHFVRAELHTEDAAAVRHALADVAEAVAGAAPDFVTPLGAKPVDFLNRFIAEAWLSASQHEAVRELLSRNEPLDRALLLIGLDEARIALGFADATGLSQLRTIEALDDSAAAQMSSKFLLRERVYPILSGGGRLYVAVADPSSDCGVRGCAFALGLDATPVIATTRQIEQLLLSLESDERDATEGWDARLGEDAEFLRDLASGEPAVRLCTRLVGEASLARASDIHIEADERRYRVRFRIDGVLRERQDLSVKQGLAAISRLKILADLDIAERRRPQDGRFSFSVSGRPLDLRISTTPSQFGEDVVIRLLRRDTERFELEALGFSPSQAATLHAMTDRPNGIVLLTGPTGCGKTTTLYALLQRLATSERKILTVEDPVEYRITGISQTQINPAIGLDFAKALKHFLRHDPDIIMVGEMRDLETARTAVQAALTGHLVLSTLHTNDAPSAVTRLLDMGVDDFLLASTLTGVVGQRLVRKICASCGGRPRDAETPPCPPCEGSGFHGRLAVSEVLAVDDRLRAMIKSGVAIAELARVAAENGFQTMAEDGAAKVAAGLTTRAELERTIVL